MRLVAPERRPRRRPGDIRVAGSDQQKQSSTTTASLVARQVGNTRNGRDWDKLPGTVRLGCSDMTSRTHAQIHRTHFGHPKQNNRDDDVVVSSREGRLRRAPALYGNSFLVESWRAEVREMEADTGTHTEKERESQGHFEPISRHSLGTCRTRPSCQRQPRDPRVPSRRSRVQNDEQIDGSS